MTNHPAVKLRPIEKTDLAYLRRLANEPEVRDNVVGWDWPLSDAGQEAWFSRLAADSSTRRFVIESETGEPIGLTGFWDIDWRNRTAMTAIKLGAFLDAGFNRLHATILATNSRSLAAYVRKSGWAEEGILRKHIWKNGEYVDLVQIGILRSEFVEQLDSHSRAAESLDKNFSQR
jgi:RimJ/RimL family protein N-acetyltransferase